MGGKDDFSRLKGRQKNPLKCYMVIFNFTYLYITESSVSLHYILKMG